MIDDWYEIQNVSDGISLIREKYVANWLRCNIWHVRGKNFDLLIDTGMGLRPLKKEIAALSQNPIKVISTHCHFDHIGGAHEFDCRLGHKSEEYIHAASARHRTFGKYKTRCLLSCRSRCSLGSKTCRQC